MNKKIDLKILVCALAGLLFPSCILRHFLNLFGHRVAAGSRIGFSWVYCSSINLGEAARIGNFNFIRLNRILIRESAWVGRSNVISGPFDMILREKAVVGNRNKILRARRGVSSGAAQLWLDELSAITSDHRLDCTQTIRLGKNSFLAGAGSQVWTHGYIHDLEGAGRYRLDGRVTIENNVYIGSACMISMGVRVSQGVIVGGGTSVSKSILKPGLYVAAPIRFLERPDFPENRPDLTRLADPDLCETVFLKRRP